ncbi:MAG TPA: EAL domain-containing protein [Mycobacterium sp.]|jgi:diguanylate cyclase (GGDEF)-like protein|nr:EAL domain-containing protein [Mycobacterium sp.]
MRDGVGLAVGPAVVPESELVAAGTSAVQPRAEGVPLPARAGLGGRWLAVLVLGLAAIGGYYVLPQAGVGQAVVISLVAATGAVAALIAACRGRGLTRVVWACLGVGMSLSTMANAPYYGFPLITGRFLPFPSPVDAVWLSTYPCFVAALVALARQRRGDDQRGNLLDALILFAGGGTVMWVYMLYPAVSSGGLAPLAHLVTGLYPTMDLVVFAMLVRLLVGARRNTAMTLLVVSFVALLGADLLEAIGLSHGWYHVGGPSDGIWMLSYLLIAVAALHPTARAFPDAAPGTSHRITGGRLLFLIAALVVGPVMWLTHPHEAALAAASTLTTLLLVVARMVWLNRRLAAARADVEQKTDELRHLALHDALTGLPNRALISDRIEHLLARSHRLDTLAAALFVDLDEFKNVNDSLGHEAGDQLLQAVATRLSGALREADTIGRLGGDEFVVLIDAASLYCAPELVAERILDVMRQPFELGPAGLPIVVTTSIGIAVGSRQTPSELLREADVALYEAKAAGKNCYATFHPDMSTEVQQRFELEFDLRAALDQDQFRLVYRPIYNLDDLTMIGVEALLRWDHPTRGRIGPDAFIPLLESSGQIVEVGRWVLRQACTQMAAWRHAGSDLGVSVNISARQLDRDAIIDHVREALEHSGLEPGALTIEITETALMRDVESSARRLRELKALGVGAAIDDFGTGYSSLSYLQRFPVDCLKIDRTFTDAITRSPESDALIRTLVQLGKDLGLKTLAEGVEHTGQIAHLRGEQVNQVQGFLLAHPLDPHTLETQILNPNLHNQPT